MHSCFEQSRDWAALEYDVLGVILNKMVCFYDYLRFKLVCKSWKFIALRYEHQRCIMNSKIPQLPMLIVPSKHGVQKQHCLFDLTNNEIRPADFKFRFDKRCCGSSFGWLIMLEKTLDVTLFNPFSGTVIRLPPINLEPDDTLIYTPSSIFKAIVTKDPSLHPNDYMVVAIYTSFRRLCLMKANDKAWIYHDSQEQHYFGDVNVFNDTLYALGHDLRFWKVEVENGSISLKRVVFNLNSDVHHDLQYVAESSKRELLFVTRFFSVVREQPADSEIARVKTTKFSVYKLSHECDEDGIERAVEVESLDGDAMFIGDNQSICFSTKDFPKCLPNRIYYTDNCHTIPLLYGPQDAGIYNLEDKNFDKHYIIDRAHRNLPPPIWILPTICFKEKEKK